ncbi:MAG: hypothetical protein ABI823_11765, partial [Bryobacteraceae bacterium]
GMVLILGTAFASADAPLPTPIPGQVSELAKAADEFKSQTRAMGLRADSPVRAKSASAVGPKWHGRVFNNWRNDILDAVPHEIRQRGENASLLRRNQFGFNIAGPVVIPKLFNGRRGTFFSFSWEAVRERISRSSLRTIPIALERTGDFSQTVDASGKQLAIYDPATTRPNPDFDPGQPVSPANLQYLRDPFSGNRIPVSRLDPVARQLLTMYPAANANAGPYFQNNFFAVSPETNRASGIIAKVDHTIGDRQRVSANLSYSTGFAGAPRIFVTAADPGGNDRDFRARGISVTYTASPSPHLTNVFTTDLFSDNDSSGRAGEAQPVPVFRFNEYVGMGRSHPTARSSRTNFSVRNTASLRSGKHTVRWDARLTKFRVDAFLPAYPEGNFHFSQGLTSLPGIDNTGNSFASYLLGLSDYAQQDVVQSPSYWRRSIANVSLSDQYEATDGLSLNFGCNLAVTTPRTEKYDRYSTIDLTAINPANGAPGALVPGHAFQPVAVRPEPNVSVAYSPGDRKTVMRLGYRLSSQPSPMYTTQWATQGFNGTPTHVSPNPQLAPAMVLEQGLPPIEHPLPDLRPDAVNGTVADLVEPSGRQPIYQNASLTVERELPAQTHVWISLGHAEGENLYVGNSAANPNAVPLSALAFRDQLNDDAFNSTLRPYPQFRRFDVGGSWPIGNYKRNSASIRLEKRTTEGLFVSASYEYSKQLDDYSGPYGVQDYFNRSNEWALTAYNDPHRVSINYAYDLPFGANKPFLNYSDWRKAIVDGWSVSGMTSILSGEPLALRPMFNNTGNVVDALNVNVVPGVDPHVADQGPALWFNPAAFEQPAPFTTGNASRTNPGLRTPGNQNHDLAVTKRIAVDTGRTVELSATGFNFTNHANWNDPDTTIGPASSPNLNAGHIIGSRGGRVIQLGLKFSF